MNPARAARERKLRAAGGGDRVVSARCDAIAKKITKNNGAAATVGRAAYARNVWLPYY